MVVDSVVYLVVNLAEQSVDDLALKRADSLAARWAGAKGASSDLLWVDLKVASKANELADLSVCASVAHSALMRVEPSDFDSADQKDVSLASLLVDLKVAHSVSQSADRLNVDWEYVSADLKADALVEMKARLLADLKVDCSVES